MELTAGEKAAVLVEALPYIRNFYGKTIVVKYGGHVAGATTLEDIVLMKYVGMHPVLVHGGGPEITRWLERLGLASRFVNGLRVTDAATMEVVEMVLAGKINKHLVAEVERLGGKAIGFSGQDASLIRARKKEGEIDLGYVGEVARVNTDILQTAMAQGYIPIIASTGVGPEGESYNINADEVAGEIAVALAAAKLVILTDVPGILADPQDPQSLLSAVHVGEVPELTRRGTISGGMLPKVACCRRALEEGVGRAHIIDGRLPHAILLEIFTDEGIGTMVVP